MTEIFSYKFIKKMISTAHIFSIQIVYRFCLDDDKADFWNDNSDISDDLINMSKRLYTKYHNFFNTWNADQLASHWAHNHVIDLKSDTELFYMCMYNMFLAELKTLNNYLNNILVKKWIHESQNSAGALILFISQKSEELCLCVNYHKLNIIIIKNCYFLLLTSKLLNQLNDSTVFSKIDLQNAYH